MIEGMFIVLEGIDGSGTTTQAHRLVDALRERGLPVRFTREPSDGPIGAMIRQVLTGRIVVPGLHGPRAPDWATMALLFAADRLDHVDAEIRPNLMDGVTVISDRYDYSSVAYQTVTAGGGEGTIDFVKQINAQARRPDLTIVLDVPAERASARRESRGQTRELYELDELQRALAEFYLGIDRHFPSDRIVHVDGDRSIDEVACDVMNCVRAARGEPRE